MKEKRNKRDQLIIEIACLLKDGVRNANTCFFFEKKSGFVFIFSHKVYIFLNVTKLPF